MAGGNLLLEVDSDATLSVRQITAHEHVGRQFQLDIIAMSCLSEASSEDEGPHVDVDAIIGKRAVVRVQQNQGTQRVWSGIVS